MKEYFHFRNHLVMFPYLQCITFEMLSINLYEFIRNNNFQGVSSQLVRRFAIQILISLMYMAEHNIVHCDLKPENILLQKPNKSGIKLIDFGSGCFEKNQIYTYI
jgi:dual specificity tyrosine-phosphorylation-regulated kinase 2/3/4